MHLQPLMACIAFSRLFLAVQGTFTLISDQIADIHDQSSVTSDDTHPFEHRVDDVKPSKTYVYNPCLGLSLHMML